MRSTTNFGQDFSIRTFPIYPVGTSWGAEYFNQNLSYGINYHHHQPLIYSIGDGQNIKRSNLSICLRMYSEKYFFFDTRAEYKKEEENYNLDAPDYHSIRKTKSIGLGLILGKRISIKKSKVFMDLGVGLTSHFFALDYYDKDWNYNNNSWDIESYTNQLVTPTLTPKFIFQFGRYF